MHTCFKTYLAFTLKQTKNQWSNTSEAFLAIVLRVLADQKHSMRMLDVETMGQ